MLTASQVGSRHQLYMCVWEEKTKVDDSTPLTPYSPTSRGGMGGGSQSNSSHEQERMIALATLALKSPTSQLTSQSKLQGHHTHIHNTQAIAMLPYRHIPNTPSTYQQTTPHRCTTHCMQQYTTQWELIFRLIRCTQTTKKCMKLFWSN